MHPERCACPGWTEAHWLKSGGIGCTYCRDHAETCCDEHGTHCIHAATVERENDDPVCECCAAAEQIEEAKA